MFELGNVFGNDSAIHNVVQSLVHGVCVQKEQVVLVQTGSVAQCLVPSVDDGGGVAGQDVVSTPRFEVTLDRSVVGFKHPRVFILKTANEGVEHVRLATEATAYNFGDYVAIVV